MEQRVDRVRKDFLEVLHDKRSEDEEKRTVECIDVQRVSCIITNNFYLLSLGFYKYILILAHYVYFYKSS